MSRDPQQPGASVALPIVHFGEEFSMNLSTLAAVRFCPSGNVESQPGAPLGNSEPAVLVYLVGGYEPIELQGNTAQLFTAWFNATSGRGRLVNRIVDPSLQ